MQASERTNICIVTPDYLSATPRVVKEADALHAAGYRVRVVFSEGNLAMKREHDRTLLRGKPWARQIILWKPGGLSIFRYLLSGFRRKLYRQAPPALWGCAGVPERAEGRVYPELAKAAAASPADLHMGHYPPGLAAAAWAAERWGAKLGYDARTIIRVSRSRTRSGLVQNA